MKRSPAAAFWLSLLPGLGHLYLGQMAMGVALAFVAAGIINIADRSDGFGIVIPIFWGFVMLDAHRAAQELNRSAERGDPQSLGRNLGSPWWGVLLIVMGVLFLLSNLEIEVFEYVARFWPLALIGLGVKLIKQSRTKATSVGAPPMPPPPMETTETPSVAGEGNDNV